MNFRQRFISMRIFQIFLALAALFALAACGGGGGSGGFSSGAGLFNYAPNVADSGTDTSLASISDDGISGILSQADIGATSVSSRLRSVKVRISADGNTAFLTVEGVTQTIPVVIKQPGGGQFGSVPSNVLQVTGSNANHVLMTYSGTSGASGFGGFGYVGIETPAARLPTSDASYSGSWGGQAYHPGNSFANSGVVLGNMDVTLNFQTGSAAGSFTGNLNAADTGSFSGTISGNTSGNGAAGTMTINSSGFSGAMPFAGKTFGFNAEDFAGGFAGSMTADGSGRTYSMTGTFSLN
ncbi:MAG: hypothetical protein KJO67_15365 [Silicimonas sp.]|nr:hypothetical protein [Silicimonas sp.]NNL34253.1 hypothetical protein [Silicimonas sp.]